MGSSVGDVQYREVGEERQCKKRWQVWIHCNGGSYSYDAEIELGVMVVVEGRRTVPQPASLPLYLP